MLAGRAAWSLFFSGRGPHCGHVTASKLVLLVSPVPRQLDLVQEKEQMWIHLGLVAPYCKEDTVSVNSLMDITSKVPTGPCLLTRVISNSAFSLGFMSMHFSHRGHFYHKPCCLLMQRHPAFIRFLEKQSQQVNPGSSLSLWRRRVLLSLYPQALLGLWC